MPVLARTCRQMPTLPQDKSNPLVNCCFHRAHTHTHTPLPLKKMGDTISAGISANQTAGQPARQAASQPVRWSESQSVSQSGSQPASQSATQSVRQSGCMPCMHLAAVLGHVKTSSVSRAVFHALNAFFHTLERGQTRFAASFCARRAKEHSAESKDQRIRTFAVLCVPRI